MALNVVNRAGNCVFDRGWVIVSRGNGRFRVWQQRSGNAEHSEVRPACEADPQHGRPLSLWTRRWSAVV